ncbi:coiled-coil-helix-coiled-coil-helix domain containing 3a [Rhincodon typus]|uniref:coiled-coil-helix-coiled-coil-helix domain containing 3a n=1 Tax=Rhincodon typus TaxID=259920 RepID=UPI00202F1069|nr:coiled-coil-helix-coiled-coil-helix domain containing 3a [Rhincodon typus]
MGGSGSTKRVSFEADENDQITVVKGIRLSDSVISRMRDASSPAEKPQSSSAGPPSSTGTCPPHPVQPKVTQIRFPVFFPELLMKYKSQPICAELQGEVLRCYQTNPQQTLSCSALAKQYIHCINYAKQSLYKPELTQKKVSMQVFPDDLLCKFTG